MLHRIEPQETHRVRPILAGLMKIHLHITAILEGASSGTIYVDDRAHPRTAYVASGHVAYLAGATDNQAFNKAVNAALPRDTYFVLFCEPDSWGNALDAILKDTYAIRTRRRYHTLGSPRIADWQARIPEGFSMQRVDADLLARGLDHTPDAIDAILDEWVSVERFLEKGFGFCLVHDGAIVTRSLVDYVSGDRCEMAIYTDADYRRQGLGTLTAAANAAYAVEQGFATVGWHCWDNNAGSIGVARNVGFERAAHYEVFINHWAAENITDMSQDAFRTFAEQYEREFETNPPRASGYPHVVAATAWALARDRAGCFRHLNRAVDLGWLRGVEHLRELWPEFFWNPNLDEMEEWQALAQRFQTTE
jgi:GNAT superfamily N-acetyltransferase